MRSESLFAFGTDAEAQRVLNVITQDDPFRLVIWGHSLVEEALDAAINDAFADGTPDELKRIRLAGRVALARGLGLISDEVARAIVALAKIRNDLAHHVDAKLTREHVRSLRRAVKPFWPADVDPDGYSRIDKMRIAVGAVVLATYDTTQHALAKRREHEAALAAYQRGRTLTAQDIRSLLAGDGEAIGAVNPP
jgi:hypothetical protein